jgi:Ca2+-binding EF-hand superfamily protein
MQSETAIKRSAPMTKMKLIFLNMFQNMDYDADSKVTKKEFMRAMVEHRAIKLFFAQPAAYSVDTATGAIKVESFAERLNRVGLFEQIDKNGDGEITWAEFEEALEGDAFKGHASPTLDPKTSMAVMREVFSAADAEHNGTLTKEEIINVLNNTTQLQSLLFQLTPSGVQYKDVFEQLEHDSSDVITWSEFEHACGRAVPLDMLQTEPWMLGPVHIPTLAIVLALGVGFYMFQRSRK